MCEPPNYMYGKPEYNEVLPVHFQNKMQSPQGKKR